MRTELSFSYGQYKFVYTDPNAAPTGTTGSLNFKQYNTTVTPQLVYNLYNKEKLKVFVDLGAAINFSSYSHHAYMITYDLFAPRIQDNYPEFYKFWVAFPVKAGIAVNKKFEVYFSYMPSTTNAQGAPQDFSVVHTAYFTGFNYFFGVK